MTFSLRPSSGSDNRDRGLGEHPGGLLEGGRRQPRVRRERALVMPMSSGRPEAGCRPSDTAARFASSKRPARRARRAAVGGAGVEDRHATRHLPHDDLDVLVVDVHALRGVHDLHLVDQVLLRGRGPRMRRTFFGSPHRRPAGYRRGRGRRPRPAGANAW